LRNFANFWPIPQDQEVQPANELTRMIAWTRERIASLEQSLQSEHILALLTREKLFPETDELHDPLGEPPQGSW
jgi:hypothetical protein